MGNFANARSASKAQVSDTARMVWCPPRPFVRNGQDMGRTFTTSFGKGICAILMSLAVIAVLVLIAFTPAYAKTVSLDEAHTGEAFEVHVSDAGDAAVISGASFALNEFARFEKGSNQERGGAYIGYNYYEGSSPDLIAAVAFTDTVIVYLPETYHALCDLGDATALCQLQAYLCALDEASNKGGALIADIPQWVFSNESTFAYRDVVITFSRPVGAERYYLTIEQTDGSVVDTDFAAGMLPTQVDVAYLCEASEDVVPLPRNGIASFIAFLQGIDYSPLWVTLKTTGCAIVFIFILGLAAAYFTLRIPKRARDIFDTIFTIPMVLPPTVCGFLLLLLLGRNTELGRWFIDIGFPLIFSWQATVIAATVVAFPLMYRSCRGAFENLDQNMLDAARTLGWSNARIFFKLMIPLSWSSIAAATVLAFARALGEFGATLFLAGNYVGVTQTIPIAIYFEWMGGNMDIALFWTVIIIIFSFAVILFINLWSRHTTQYRLKEVAK